MNSEFSITGSVYAKIAFVEEAKAKGVQLSNEVKEQLDNTLQNPSNVSMISDYTVVWDKNTKCLEAIQVKDAPSEAYDLGCQWDKAMAALLSR